MKKNVFLALLMLVVAFSTVSFKKEVKKNDLKDNGLNGKVKYIEIKTYSVSNNFGEIQKGKLLEYEFKSFNKDGNYLNIIYGSLEAKNIYKYDSKGNNIEESLYNFDGSMEVKYIYKYDSKGNMIEESEYDSDGNLKRKYIYKNDSKGNMIEEIIKKNAMEIPFRITERKIVYYGDADEYNYPEWDSETFNGLRVESNY
mgnify:CR=1 FL=1